MALRSVLGKMANTMTSSKCIHKNGRLVLRIGRFEAINHNPNHSNKNKDAPSMDDRLTSYLFEMGCYDENGVRIPMTVNRGIDYHMDLGGIGPARFSVEEFNKRKKTQLQLVRVQRTWMKPLYHHRCMYELILDAVDAAGVVNFYLAYVEIDDINEGMWLEEFNIFRDNGYPARLYHHLDNFFVE
ncbi:uncharacterized protein LOC121049115 [Rosa chinensis]|uniref:uncharacterized protein LOC121049115 n=1 Tax=Rosa chinensis TaxID=74649 RepID=UPI001AD92A0D|nr:uncharacterized protein LOC121049115 [Rosa chinensis]